MARKSAKPISTTGSAASAPPTAHSDMQKVSPVASASRDRVQRAALLASITGRSFEDVKFFAFSRRTRNGSIDTPLPLLANSALIRKASLTSTSFSGLGSRKRGHGAVYTPFCKWAGILYRTLLQEGGNGRVR
ncbi:hypothetical protein LXA43DRAFT_1057726 [Ganoderma leucocontextum]|nr:hypothetical protein LXA43DRAFT_1057726 [Ganoderma leucocontextum]